ncbi:hypothetical protein MRY87_09395 [bacterium]|nr:hypothetical protein [bacterium]
MRKMTGKFVARGVLAALFLTGMAACGGSNNDQGVGFLNLGFSLPDATLCTTGQGGGGGGGGQGQVSGLSELAVGLSDASDPNFGGDVFATLNFQNNLDGQAISVDRLNLSYYIPGASAQPPSTVRPMPILLGPPFITVGGGSNGGGAGAGGGAGFGSSLPPAFFGVPNCQASTVGVLPDQIRAWVSLNRSFLPDAPFDMLVTASADGETTSADRLTTNEVTLLLTVVPDSNIAENGAS